MKPIISKFTIVFISVLVVSTIVYLLGPKPPAPKLTTYKFELPSNLSELENEIKKEEFAVKGLKPDCEARIIWVDSLKKQRTKYAFLYLHGGTSTWYEGNPVHKNIAKKFGANLYLARLAGHGVNLGDKTFSNVSTDDFIKSAEKALAITEELGDKVIIMGTSFGGALATYLASKHKNVKALVLFSPCIETYDKRTNLFIKPWGLQLIKKLSGSGTVDVKPISKEYEQYWTTHYDLNFIAQFQNFLTHAMTKKTFGNVKSPVFMAYWYKSDNVKDTIASVPSMLKMYDGLGSKQKQKIAYPNAGNHAIITPLLSNEVDAIQLDVESFLNKLIKRD